MRVNFYLIYFDLFLIIFYVLRDVGISPPLQYNHGEFTEQFENELLEEEFYGEGFVGTRDARKIALKNIKKLNKDQLKAFKAIVNSINGNSQQHLFFLQGSGGTGNSNFI